MGADWDSSGYTYEFKREVPKSQGQETGGTGIKKTSAYFERDQAGNFKFEDFKFKRCCLSSRQPKQQEMVDARPRAEIVGSENHNASSDDQAQGNIPTVS